LGGEEPEPFEGGGGVAVFAGEGSGDVDAGEADFTIGLPELAGGFDLCGDFFAEGGGRV
jgi:hypothetical protein